MWLQACALDALSEPTFLALSVESLHPVLDLIDGFLLPIEPLDSYQIEHVTYQVALDGHIERRFCGHGRAQIDLNQPRLQIRVNQDVKAEQFKAVGPMRAILLHGGLDVVLAAEDCLDDDIVDAGPEQVHVDAHLLQVLAEGAQAPLVAEIVLLCVLILNETIILLVNGVVRQVHVFVLLIDLLGVSFGGESG